MASFRLDEIGYWSEIKLDIVRENFSGNIVCVNSAKQSLEAGRQAVVVTFEIKLEIEPQIFYDGKFKSATEPFREEKMTEANRLQTSVWLGTDFQVMFLFSIGITKGKWGTLLTNLLAFKRAYDSNRPLAEVLPEIAAQYPDRYRNVRLHDLGDELFEYLRENRPGELLNAAFESLPNADMTPREAYERLVAGNVESVAVHNLAGRTAANAIMPYPPGIPMLMSGENFGGADSSQIGYLAGMQNREQQFPGFAGVIEGAELIDGTYHVLCVKT